MSRMQIPVVGDAYEHRSRNIDMSRTVNLYPEIESGSSKSPAALLGTPGLKPFFTSENEDDSGRTLMSGPVRLLYPTSQGSLLAVVDHNVYLISSTGSGKKIGLLPTVSGMVNATDNGRQICMVDGVNGYIIDTATNRLSIISAEAFPAGATHVVFKDGYFIVNKPGTGEIWWSALYDGTAWDGLNYATAEGSPDYLVALAKTNNELWLFGTQSTEIWYNSGNSDQPFQRINNAFQDIGTNAPYSVASNGNEVFWLGSNRSGENIIWHASGYNPQRISTHAIEYILSGMIKTSDAVAYTYQQEGHFFYVISFPLGSRTFVYDLTTGMWHERQSFRSGGEMTFSSTRHSRYIEDLQRWQQGRHRVHCACSYNGKIYGGDYSTGDIYELDLATYTDNGAAIIRERVVPHLHSQMNRVYYYEFELDMAHGIGAPYGLTTVGASAGHAKPGFNKDIGNYLPESRPAQFFDTEVHPAGTQANEWTADTPQVSLSWSNDGGYTWGTERWEPIGRLGTYKTRMHWHALGCARDRVFKIRISDPIPVTILNAWIDAETEEAG